MATERGSIVKAWASAIFLVLALGLFGLFFGALVATRIFATGGMGWDQIADFLGGAMLGGIAGLLLAVLIVGRVASGLRLIIGLVALLGSAGAMLYMRLAPPNIRPGKAVVIPPLVEPFGLTLGAGNPLAADGTEGVRPADPAMPWNILRMGSNLAFDYIRQDAPHLHCVVTGSPQSGKDIAAAKNLRAALQRLPAALNCAPPCPGCAAITLDYYLAEERRAYSFDSVCWRNEPALQPLRSAILAITAGSHASARTCDAAP